MGWIRNRPLDISGGRSVCLRDGSQSTAGGETGRDPDRISALFCGWSRKTKVNQRFENAQCSTKNLALRNETRFYTDKQVSLFLTFLAIYYFIGLLINKEMETDLFSILIEFVFLLQKGGGNPPYPPPCIRPWTTPEAKIVSNGNVLAGTFGRVNLKSNIL